MAIKKAGYDMNVLDTGSMSLPLDGATSFAINTLGYSDRANGYVERVSTTVGRSVDSLWVARATVAADATAGAFIPANEGLFEVDCTNNTAANQLLKRHIMTNETAVNNTSSDVATSFGIFEALAIKGAASDKKLIGRFIVVNQFADDQV